MGLTGVVLDGDEGEEGGRRKGEAALAACLALDLVVRGLQPRPEPRLNTPCLFQCHGQDGRHRQSLGHQAI